MYFSLYFSLSVNDTCYPPQIYHFRSSWPCLRLQKRFVRIFYLLRQLTLVLVHSKLKKFVLLLLEGRNCMLIAFVPGDFVFDTFAEHFVPIQFRRSTSRLTAFVNVVKVVVDSMNISDNSFSSPCILQVHSFSVPLFFGVHQLCLLCRLESRRFVFSNGAFLERQYSTSGRCGNEVQT